MRWLSPVILLAALTACGSSDSGADGPGRAEAGEIQALANAQAMLETRKDDDRSAKPASQKAPAAK